MDFIEEFDDIISLWSNGDPIEAISNASEDKVFEFAETMALSSRYHFKPESKPNRNFSFIANSSLSGGRHPCTYPDCRIKKLDELVSFASLYADEVHIQNPFEEILIAGPENINEASRQELIYGIHNYFYLKPLIEKGIIKYAQNMVSLCQHHSETLAKPLSAEIERKETRLYNLLEEQLAEKCSIYFDVGEGAGPFLKIEGPDGLIDHGVRYLHLFGDLPETITELLDKKLPYKFSKKEVLSEGMLSLIISPILRDLSNQEWHSAFYGTSYLCDNATQMKIASRLNSEAYSASSSAFNKAMNHSLPSVYAKDLSDIVNLRENEGESFTVYRDKVHSLLKDTEKWSEEEVEEAFRDEILPQINMIDKKIRDWKVKTRESLKEKILFGSGAVSIGLYAGMLPPNIGQIVTAIGGGSAVAGAVMDYNKTLKDKNEARSDDFYFLWQAKQ
ncbi:hypothetical protein KO528_06090 [Saccharophagus degradans]|uniref:hypothetical protein n=1 Tax=Saccharophagus degradans TaxID=86304 RepID=UPI001C081DD0|nr:hypothetical protein [Saccharophagus degradans]MBU2984910.1 hypothetical protein [Saccharophagus degradans]